MMLWLILIVVILFPSIGNAATITAASCNNTPAQPDVRTAVDSAVDGDTVIVPAGTCTWTLWLDSIGAQYGPPLDDSTYHKNIILKAGGATPNFAASTTRTPLNILNNECAPGQTTYTCIVDGVDRSVASLQSAENLIRWDMDQPTGGLSLFTSELTGFIFVGINMLDGNNKGMIRIRGDNARLRVHHNAFFPYGTSAFFIDGNIQGVFDHNFCSAEVYFCIYTFHSQWNPGGAGSGAYGDQSYATPISIGTANAWFIEDNIFQKTSFTSSPYCCDGWNGSRVVYRHNTFHNTIIDWHGTESGGRVRGTFQFEVYDNTFEGGPISGVWASLVGARSGTGVIADNTISYTGGSLNTFFDVIDYRHDGSNSPIFGLCTGSNAWDQNTAGESGRLCLDQAGVGHGDLLSGDPPVNTALGNVAAWPRQSSIPFYVWNTICNICASSNPISHSSNIAVNRDYFLTVKPGYAKYAYPHPFTGTGPAVFASKLNFPTARCEQPTAWTKWSLPTTGRMNPLCLTGTGVRYGVLGAAAGTTSTAYAHFRLPSDFIPTQPVDVVVEYLGSTISSTTNIRTQVAIACVADGENMLGPTYNLASATNTPGPAALGAKGTVAFTAVNVANCAAGEHAIIKLDRLSGDTYAGEARYVTVELTYRRTGTGQ